MEFLSNNGIFENFQNIENRGTIMMRENINKKKCSLTNHSNSKISNYHGGILKINSGIIFNRTDSNIFNYHGGFIDASVSDKNDSTFSIKNDGRIISRSGGKIIRPDRIIGNKIHYV